MITLPMWRYPSSMAVFTLDVACSFWAFHVLEYFVSDCNLFPSQCYTLSQAVGEDEMKWHSYVLVRGMQCERSAWHWVGKHVISLLCSTRKSSSKGGSFFESDTLLRDRAHVRHTPRNAETKLRQVLAALAFSLRPLRPCSKTVCCLPSEERRRESLIRVVASRGALGGAIFSAIEKPDLRYKCSLCIVSPA